MINYLLKLYDFKNENYYEVNLNNFSDIDILYLATLFEIKCKQLKIDLYDDNSYLDSKDAQDFLWAIYCKMNNKLFSKIWAGMKE
jgi:hypothetical protein